MEPVHFYGESDGENDLPESGVADHGGQPHYFWFIRYRFEVPHCAEFELAPVSPEVFQSVLELAAIWRRWELAYHGGEVPLETHPALPQDRNRSQTVRAAIEADQAQAREHVFVRVGTFRTSDAYLQKIALLVGKRWPVPGWHSAELEVSWSEA